MSHSSSHPAHRLEFLRMLNSSSISATLRDIFLTARSGDDVRSRRDSGYGSSSQYNSRFFSFMEFAPQSFTEVSVSQARRSLGSISPDFNTRGSAENLRLSEPVTGVTWDSHIR